MHTATDTHTLLDAHCYTHTHTPRCTHTHTHRTILKRYPHLLQYVRAHHSTDTLLCAQNDIIIRHPQEHTDAHTQTHVLPAREPHGNNGGKRTHTSTPTTNT